jgi:hypothetical protein
VEGSCQNEAGWMPGCCQQQWLRPLEVSIKLA